MICFWSPCELGRAHVLPMALIPPSNPGRLPAGKLQAKPLENSLLIWLYGPIKPGRGLRVLKACCTTLNSHHVIYAPPYWSSRLHSDRLISNNLIREECVNCFYSRCKLPTRIKGTLPWNQDDLRMGYHSLCSLLF